MPPGHLNELDKGWTRTTVGPEFQTHLERSCDFLGVIPLPSAGPRLDDRGAGSRIMKMC